MHGAGIGAGRGGRLDIDRAGHIMAPGDIAEVEVRREAATRRRKLADAGDELFVFDNLRRRHFHHRGAIGQVGERGPGGRHIAIHNGRHKLVGDGWLCLHATLHARHRPRPRRGSWRRCPGTRDLARPQGHWGRCRAKPQRRQRFVIDDNGKERLSVEGKPLGNPRGIGSLGSVGARQGIVKPGT